MRDDQNFKLKLTYEDSQDFEVKKTIVASEASLHELAEHISNVFNLPPTVFYQFLVKKISYAHPSLIPELPCSDSSSTDISDVAKVTDSFSYYPRPQTHDRCKIKILKR